MENLNLKQRNSKLFGYLDEILSVSQKKFNKEKASNTTRQKWARVMIQAIATYGKILEISALEQIEERVRALEQTHKQKSKQR